jgi:antitoxin HicB
LRRRLHDQEIKGADWTIAFLKQKGLYEGVTARAIKRVIARQLDALMHEQGISKTELARSMKTSRVQLDRLLDPENESVTLGTLTRAAQAVGRNLRMELVRRWIACAGKKRTLARGFNERGRQLRRTLITRTLRHGAASFNPCGLRRGRLAVLVA